jgi:hypothetical protein
MERKIKMRLKIVKIVFISFIIGKCAGKIVEVTRGTMKVTGGTKGSSQQWK